MRRRVTAVPTVPSALSTLLIVAAAIACGSASAGADAAASSDAPAPGADACDPSTRTYDVPDLAAPMVMHAQVDPAGVDPAATAYPQSKHQLYVPTAPGVVLRDELFVILPGTNNLAQGFETLALLAAAAGYRVVALAYESETHPLGVCAGVADLDAHLACREGVWTEKAYGVEASAEYPGDFANSIAGRLVRLLQRVHADSPAAGIDAFFDGDQVRWDRVVLAGFSQGSALAGFIGKDQALARLILLAGGCDDLTVDGEPTLAPWCSAPRATPAARTWAISHAADEPIADAMVAEAYGLFALGPYAEASAQSPSYCSGTHALLSREPTATPHLSIALDGSIPLSGGVPTLAEDYYYAFTAPHE